MSKLVVSDLLELRMDAKLILFYAFLSPREADVLELVVAHGLTQTAAAAELSISCSRVSSVMRQIERKLKTSRCYLNQGSLK